MKYRSDHSYDPNKASNESALCCKDPSLAKQSFAEECDINTIVKRFGIGEYAIPEGTTAPVYADFTGVVDFHTACNAIAKANEAFDALPATVRARFQNDPGQFVDFCSQDGNRDELVKLGLIVPPPAPAPAPAPAAPTEPVAASTDPKPT